jgi:hypothetical protein
MKFQTHSPSIYGAVVLNTDLTFAGETYVARGLWASADGTITVLMEDGVTSFIKQVFKGPNVFRFRRVTANGGALTLEWFA